MKGTYWYCAYGHVMRLSDRLTSADEAARNTFGIPAHTISGPGRVTCIDVGGRHPRYFTVAKKQELYEKLKKLHKAKTGNDLQ